MTVMRVCISLFHRSAYSRALATDLELHSHVTMQNISSLQLFLLLCGAMWQSWIFTLILLLM